MANITPTSKRTQTPIDKNVAPTNIANAVLGLIAVAVLVGALLLTNAISDLKDQIKNIEQQMTEQSEKNAQKLEELEQRLNALEDDSKGTASTSTEKNSKKTVSTTTHNNSTTNNNTSTPPADNEESADEPTVQVTVQVADVTTVDASIDAQVPDVSITL